MSFIHRPKPWQRNDVRPTPETTFRDRRAVVKALGLGSLGLAASQLIGPRAARAATTAGDPTTSALGRSFAGKFPAERNDAFGLGGRTVTDERVAATHNNFYEFTLTKDAVWELAQGYDVEPWTVKVHGLVHKPKTFGLEDLFAFPLEERLYRFRCVERWSMQVPWTGFPLRLLLDAVEPQSTARWVRFVSVLDTKGLPGQRTQDWYPWPYFEALRLDEARHDLTLATLGVYGHGLPMQHGAPLRITAPWKYGYKSPKSIVEIELTDRRPLTFWNDMAPDEYGFFSNVEPEKPHPRWSQNLEQDIGTGETRKTLPYNGYADLVGSMYDGSEV